MKKYFYTFAIIVVLSIIIGVSTADAQLSILRPTQGGTGIGSATAGDVGDCLKVLDDSPFVYELGTCASAFVDNWTFLPNFGVTNLTPTSTMPIWARGDLFGSSTLQVGYNGTNFKVDAWDVANLGLIYAPRITPVNGGSFPNAPTLDMDGHLVISNSGGGTQVLCNSGSALPCLSFADATGLGSAAHLIFDTVTSILNFEGATEYQFDSGIRPAGIIDSSGDYGNVGQVLSNPAGGGNLDWINTSSFASKWTEFNQASRDTLVPDVTLGVSRVAIGPTNLISSVDTALSVVGGSISVASSTLLMLAEAPWITNCDPTVHDITSYSFCAGNSAGSITTGITNNLIGFSTGAALDDDSQNVLMGPYVLTGATSATNNVGMGYNAGGSNAGLINTSVFIGAESLTSNASTTGLVTIGFESAKLATTSLDSVFVGRGAGKGAFAYGGLIGGQVSTGNTGIGAYALTGLQENAKYNTAVGYSAGFTEVGDYNTYLGPYAGYSMFSNDENVAIGYNAMRGSASVGAVQNTAIGTNALFSLSSGDGNVAVGIDALYSLTTGFSNFALGEASLYSLVSGSENTAIGTSAMFSNITGNENVAIGSLSLQRNKSATTSVAVGNEAGQGTADYSAQGATYVGYRAGENVSTGSDFNSFFGFMSGALNTSGASSTYLGYRVGDNVTIGSHNIGFGSNIDMPSATADNQLNIGNIIFGTAIDGMGSTISTGNIGIATTSPSSLLQLFSTATTTLSIDSNSATKGSCIELKDIDGGGYTYIYSLNGTIYSDTVSCK